MFNLMVKFILVSAIITFNINAEANCPNIISKKKWGGLPATGIEYQILPIKYVIIHHTVTDRCNSKATCATLLQNMQSYHQRELENYDIPYNFLVGNDGNIYQGVGWHVVGAHTYGYNRNGLGIGFIGDFTDALPSQSAIDAAKLLLKCGVELGELDSNYKLLGGKQLISSASPGLELYGEIQDWDNWVERP